MLDEISARLLNSHSLNEVLDYTLTRFIEQFGFKVGVIMQFKNGKGKISHYINQGYPIKLFLNIESLTIDDIMSLTNEIDKNIFTHQYPPKPNKKIERLKNLLHENQLTFGLSLLFKVRGKVWGALHLWHHQNIMLEPPALSEYDVMNRIIGLALENQWLRSKSNMPKTDNTKELLALNNIISSINYTQDLYGVLKKALKETLDVLNLKAGGVYLIDEREEYAELITSVGMPLEYVKQFEYLSIHNPSVSTVMSAGQSLVTVELAFENPELYQLQHQFGIKRIVSIPLRSRNHILGFLNLSVPPFRTFDNNELYLLDSISKQLGVAIEIRRLTEQHIHCTANQTLLYSV